MGLHKAHPRTPLGLRPLFHAWAHSLKRRLGSRSLACGVNHSLGTQRTKRKLYYQKKKKKKKISTQTQNSKASGLWERGSCRPQPQRGVSHWRSQRLPRVLRPAHCLSRRMSCRVLRGKHPENVSLRISIREGKGHENGLWVPQEWILRAPGITTAQPSTSSQSVQWLPQTFSSLASPGRPCPDGSV